MTKTKVDKEFYRWVNGWAGLDDSKLKTKEEQMAYCKAVHDIFSRISCPNAYPLSKEEMKK